MSVYRLGENSSYLLYCWCWRNIRGSSDHLLPLSNAPSTSRGCNAGVAQIPVSVSKEMKLRESTTLEAPLFEPTTDAHLIGIMTSVSYLCMTSVSYLCMTSVRTAFVSLRFVSFHLDHIELTEIYLPRLSTWLEYYRPGLYLIWTWELRMFVQDLTLVDLISKIVAIDRYG